MAMAKQHLSVINRESSRVEAGMIALIGSDPEPAASWKKIRPVLPLDSVAPWIVWEALQVTEDKPVSAIKQESKTPVNSNTFLNYIKPSRFSGVAFLFIFKIVKRML